MEESIVKKINEDPEFDLIPQKDVSLLKIKLGKGHRKESDWDVIKEILTSHELIVAEPNVSDDFVSAVNHVMACEKPYFCFDQCRSLTIKIFMFERGRFINESFRRYV